MQHAAASASAHLLLENALRPGPVLGNVAAGACSGDATVADICRFTLRSLAGNAPDRLAMLMQAFSQAPVARRAAFAQVNPVLLV